MKRLIDLTLVMLLIVFAGLSCKWERTGTNAGSNSNTAAAVTPEPESSPAGSEAEAKFVAAEPLVVELYKQHDADKGPFRERKRAVVDKYFAKPLADLIWKDQQTPAGEMGMLDFDPLYNAQDIEIKRLAVGKASVNGDKATIPVTFENYGEKTTLKFQMVRQSDAWKISDINYPGGSTLLDVFKANVNVETPEKPDPVGDEFEGKYRVGDTTCIVKPVKMAFEIRWAKGSGSEYFFYKDANVFESEEDKSGGRNEFRFDDANYNSGTFVRADGKIFPISRAK